MLTHDVQRRILIWKQFMYKRLNRIFNRFSAISNERANNKLSSKTDLLKVWVV